MSSESNIFLLVLLSCVFFQIFAQSNVGSRCTIQSDNTPGVCKLLTDCPDANKGNGTPTICGFFRIRTPIVCCKETKSAKPNENTFLNRDKYNDGFLFPDSAEQGSSKPSRHKSKSQQKCSEYSKPVKKVVSAAPLITNPEIVSMDHVNCDNNALALIVDGEPVAPGEFPFMAAIGYNTPDGFKWHCGGSLISDYFVLTAAHCTQSTYSGRPVKVRLGEIDLNSDDDGTEYRDYNIDDIKIHEQYAPPAHYHDIALLKLAQQVEFTTFIRPACLWNKFEIDYTASIAAGWGQIGFVEEQSDKLLKVVLQVYDNSVCAKKYQSDNSKLPKGIISNMLCAGDLKGGKDTCKGDSGGPLIVAEKANLCIFHIIGITSFGKGCGEPNLPAVYTRVSHYIPWIEKNVW